MLGHPPEYCNRRPFDGHPRRTGRSSRRGSCGPGATIPTSTRGSSRSTQSPPRPLRWTVKVKYLRTVATQLTYWPLLLRELRKADVVHVFSASYFSFLLAPLPAVLIARLLGKPVVMNYRSGRSARSPEALGHRARHAAAASTGMPFLRRFLHEVFAGFGIRSEIIPNIVDVERFRFRRRERLQAADTVDAELRSALQPAVHTARVPAGAGSLSRGATDAGWRRFPGRGDPAPGRGRCGCGHVTFAGRVPPDDIWRYYADADIYLQTPDIDNMPASVLEAFASGCAGGRHRGRRRAGNPHERGRTDCWCPAAIIRRLPAAMIRLLEDPALARRLADAALETCARYQWSSVRAQWVALYRRLVRPRGLGAATPGMSAALDRRPPGGHGPRGAPLPAHLRSAQDCRTAALRGASAAAGIVPRFVRVLDAPARGRWSPARCDAARRQRLSGRPQRAGRALPHPRFVLASAGRGIATQLASHDSRRGSLSAGREARRARRPNPRRPPRSARLSRRRAGQSAGLARRCGPRPARAAGALGRRAVSRSRDRAITRSSGRPIATNTSWRSGSAYWLTGDRRYRARLRRAPRGLAARESAAPRRELVEHAGARVPHDLLDVGRRVLRRGRGRRTRRRGWSICSSRSIAS